jgi:peptide/nickel transport system substrate-binding protein
LVRNPNYWNKPLPYLDQLTIKVIAEETQAIDTVVAGQAQAAWVASVQATNKGTSGGLKAASFKMSGGTTLAFNTLKPPFDDVRARRAVSLALNPAGLMQAAYNGEDPAVLNLFQPTSPFYDKSLKLPVNNAAEAQKLFDELAAAGKPVKFTISSFPNTEQKVPMQAALTQLAAFKNVSVSLDVLDPVTMLTRLLSKNFEAATAGTNMIDPEPQAYEQLHTGASANYGSYSNTSMDQALELGRSTADLATRKGAYKTMQRLIIQDVPAVYIRHWQPALVYSKQTTGWAMYGQGDPLVDRIGFTTKQ